MSHFKQYLGTLYSIIITYSRVEAGAVVVKDVPPYSVVVGNPGRVVKAINNHLKKTKY